MQSPPLTSLGREGYCWLSGSADKEGPAPPFEAQKQLKCDEFPLRASIWGLSSSPPRRPTKVETPLLNLPGQPTTNLGPNLTRSTFRDGHWGHRLPPTVRMHAIGARLSAARCLWAQTHAHQVFLTALTVAPRHESPRLRDGNNPCSQRPGFSQTRHVSSKPSSGSPDKPPEGNENEDGKDKGGQPAAGPEASESTPETKRQPLFSPLNGRGRSSNHAPSTGGLPPFTLPSWFLDEQIQICDLDGVATDEAWDGIERYLQPPRASFAPVQELGGIWVTSENGQASSDSAERAIGRELVSTISAELQATAPPMRATKEPKRRPVSLLYVHNYKGSRIANAIVGRIGAELAADVIHLDAARLARLAAPYFGSTLYFGRGKMSMLGYAAAEANGRSISAGPSAEEGEDDLVLRGASVFKFLQPSDDRVTWDELKLGQVAKVIADAASAKREAKGVQHGKPDRVLLHLHNYVELTMTPEGASLINKLRTTVDRLWQNGASIVIVGSASNDANASSKWHAKVKELSSHDCYPIVFSPNADELPEWKTWQRNDYLQDNLGNVSWMLDCLKAEPISVVLPSKDSNLASNEAVDELIESLSTGICSNHWIYRLATQTIGFQRYKDGPLDVYTLAEALRRMKRVDEARLSILGISNSSSTEPASVSQPPPPPLESLISLGNSMSPESKTERRKNPKNMNLDDEEKKLLSGLVNEADIHTTFDDVIAPPDVRDSLVALTTLSLQHPKAFSYGVLARERIHGALLYGPPGTGKTLMAKALAKGSGANMLEISAASINDMWVGKSSPTVQYCLSGFYFEW